MKELEELKKKISEDPSSFIIILGAGASIPAGLPSWTELKDILCEAIFDVKDDHDECKQIVDDINNSKSLWTMFKKLRNILGQLRYEKEILQSLDPDNLDTPLIYYNIWRLNPAGIIDFNIDRLAINSFSEINKTAVDYATNKEPHKFKNFKYLFEV